jgi:predicted NUDIX family NTP pyrophosphohydrolase
MVLSLLNERLIAEMLCTCGILYRISTTNIFLVGHATMSPDWSIPKGCMEENDNEDKAIAASREFKEETGILIDPSKINYIGTFKYKKEKDLALFCYHVNSSDAISTDKMFCSTYFDFKYTNKNKENKIAKLPEIDKYKYIDIKDASNYVNKKMFKILRDNIEWI